MPVDRQAVPKPEPLGFLKTTWCTRGFSYWWRRLWITIGATIFVAIWFGYMWVAVRGALTGRNRGAGIVILVASVVATVYGAVRAWRGQIRSREPDFNPRVGGPRIGRIVFAPIFFLGMGGWFLVLWLSSFRPRLNSEVRARRRYEIRMQQFNELPPMDVKTPPKPPPKVHRDESRYPRPW